MNSTSIWRRDGAAEMNNRLVFLATFGNMLTNVATLMTRSYTGSLNSFGCQFQAFLIQV